MAQSKCGACGHGRFEMKTAEPKDSAVKVNYIQCASCGAVVGVMEWSNISAHFARVDKALEESAKRERRMESHLAQIDAILRQR